MSARRALLGTLLLALAACSDPGPQPAELKDFKPAVRVSVAWRASAGDSGPYIFTPGVWEGDYFLAGQGGSLSRIDGAKGRRKWVVHLKTTLSGGVGVGEGVVVVGTAKGEVLAYSTEGKALWRSQASSEILSAPLVSDGMVIVRAGDGRVAGLSLKDGTRQWEYLPTMPALLLRGNAGIAVDKGIVFVGFPGGKLVALRISSGGLVWEAAVAQPRGDTELERIADVVGTPLVEEGQVCAVSYQGRVGCFDAARGTLIWARNASSATGLAADATGFFYADDAATVYAVDRTSGASLWKQEVLANREVGAPGRVGRYVALGDFEGYVHLLDREDGRVAGRIGTDGGPITAAPMAVGDGRLVVQTREGNLYALVLR